VLWGQAYLFNRDGSACRYWDHQVDDLRCKDRNIIHLDGRDCESEEAAHDRLEMLLNLVPRTGLFWIWRAALKDMTSAA
jgi:hypothetical protein